MLQVKEFRQPTVREAFQAIREEFGPSAVVLESGLVSARGWRGWVGMREVRVTAQAPEGLPAEPERRPAVQSSRSADTPAPTGSLAARLTAAGIAPALAESVGAAVPAKQQRHLTAASIHQHLAAHLAPYAAGAEPFARVEVFIGPPGVGKTTTIASRQTLLVDTAGRSPKDDDLRDVRRLLGRRDGVRTHLVIPADTSVATAERILSRFADAAPDRVVVSRLDEADSPSALFAWLLETGLQISYITTGQRVPEDLERATPAILAAAMLRDDLGAPLAVGLA